jgi:hypothetical protein
MACQTVVTGHVPANAARGYGAPWLRSRGAHVRAAHGVQALRNRRRRCPAELEGAATEPDRGAMAELSEYGASQAGPASRRTALHAFLKNTGQIALKDFL